MNLRFLWDGTDEITWLLHGLLGMLETFIAALLLAFLGVSLDTFWFLPATYPIFYYWVREVESYLYSGLTFRMWMGDTDKIRDHLLDVMSPTALSLLTARVCQALV